MLDSNSFYRTYHGHDKEDLQLLLEGIKVNKPEGTGIIYLVGDSTLDNKYWFSDDAPARNGYESILDPPVSKQDIAYWMNAELEVRGLTDIYTTINCAVEESTIGGRTWGLMEQDHFVSRNITANDVLVVSIGGNDVALRPSLCTIVNILALTCCTTTSCIETMACGTSCPVEDYCAGCTFGCLSNLLAFPLGYGYFLHLFGTRIRQFITRILEGKNEREQRPKKIVVCMLYYLDETPGNSWAEPTLAWLGYNKNPQHLQAVLRSVFRDATQQIKIPGTEVVAVPLFRTLNGKNPSDYAQRVEPSALGGEKMGKQLVEAILNDNAAHSSGI